jgi:hypothetical protein
MAPLVLPSNSLFFLVLVVRDQSGFFHTGRLLTAGLKETCGGIAAVDEDELGGSRVCADCEAEGAWESLPGFALDTALPLGRSRALMPSLLRPLCFPPFLRL